MNIYEGYGTSGSQIFDDGPLPREVVDEFSLESEYDEEEEIVESSPISKRVQFGILFGACLAVAGVLAVNQPDTLAVSESKDVTPVGLQALGKHKKKESGDSSLRFALWNKYILRDGHSGKDYPWLDAELLEPHHESTFSVLSAQAHRKYMWKIDGQTKHGNEVSHTFETTGRFTIEVTEKTSKGGVLSHHSREVVVKYVRREIRSLMDDDRSNFLESMQIMQNTSTEHGQRQYGAKFRDINYFSRMYLLATGEKECHHFDEGLGFLTHHSALVRSFEQVLQAVSPSISMPYWDYTKESHTMWSNSSKKKDVSLWFSSDTFDEKWFGSSDTETNRISSGRFKDLRIQSDARNFSIYTNAYGLLRSKWNTNKDLFVSRSSSTYGFTTENYPTCANMHRALQGSTWESFGSSFSTPHKKLKNMIAGASGADFRWLEKETLTFKDAQNLISAALPMATYYWRSGFMICPDTCSMDTPQEDCQCMCPEYTAVAKDGNMYQKLEDKGILSWMEDELAGFDQSIISMIDHPPKGGRRYVMYSEDESGKFTALTEDQQDHYLNIISKIACTPHSLGEAYQSTAPADPVYWPSLGSLERLWQWKRLPHDTTSKSASYAYTWSDGSSRYGDTCYGHNAGDSTPWHKDMFETTSISIDGTQDLFVNGNDDISLIAGDDSSSYSYSYESDDSVMFTTGELPSSSLEEVTDIYGIQYDASHNSGTTSDLYTNEELYKLLDPNEDNLPYIYDNFEWKHCAVEGADLEQFWDTS